MSPSSGHQPQRLMRSVLGPIDIAASTMANIAPAMSFSFGFGFLAFASGIASPLTIVAAAIAIGFLGNTLAQFSRVHPSTGSFITFIGRAFGPTSAIATAVILITGYIIAITSVIVMSGGFMAIFLNHYAPGIPISVWPLFVVVFVAFSAFLMVRGVHISTRWAGVFFAFEMVVLVVVTISALIHHAGHLTLHPFMPRYLTSGLKGVGLGFPLAVFLFIGWENSAALAEETDNPRRNVPRAVFTSIAIMAVGYLLFAYATVEGFSENVAALSSSQIPFITMASGVLGVLAFLVYLAGVTSTVGCVIAAVNSQSRLLFNAGREGLLPAWLGRVYAKRKTPVNALLSFIGVGLVLVFAWAYGQHISPVTLFAEASTLGTILVLAVYFVANLALPVFYRRYHAAEFGFVRHLVIPVVGAIVIALPIYELVRPGQAYPYDWFPYICLAVITTAVIYAVSLGSRDKTLADRVGSLVADDVTEGKFTPFFDDDERSPSLYHVVSRLNQDRDLDVAVLDALPLIAEGLHVDSAAVFVVSDEVSAKLLAVHGALAPGTRAPAALDLKDPALASAMKRPRVVEVAGWPRLPETLSTAACPGFAKLWLAPVAAGRDITGFLVFSRRRGEPLSVAETEFAVTVCEILGPIIRSRSLAAESQHTAAVLQTAYAVSRAITQSLDLELTYREIAANAARIAPGSHCLLFELDGESRDLVAAASSDPEGEQLLGARARLQDAAVSRGGAGTTVRLTFLDATAGGRAEALVPSKFNVGVEGGFAATFGEESSLVVPLFAQQGLVGSLLVYAVGRRRRYSPLEVAELQAVGEQAAIAIHNAQLFRRLEQSQAKVEALLHRLTQIREQERQSLARIVHDDIVQSIVGAMYRLDAFRDTVASVNVGEFDEAVAVLRQSVKDARRVIWELRPPALDGVRFSEALRSLGDRFRATAPVEIEASLDDVAGLGEGVTTALYKIAREALLNSVRHADARLIQVGLREERSLEDRVVRLVVEDDGVGFDMSGPYSAGDHFGAIMMDEQATLIGGTLSIFSASGHGTRVEVMVPLER